MPNFEAVFVRFGEHIHVPVTAKNRATAVGVARSSNPLFADSKWKVVINDLAPGQVAQDDRATLKWKG